MSEREKFIVPVRAVGARALLDFPDEIHFPSSPVKVCTPTCNPQFLIMLYAEKWTGYTIA